MMHLPTQDTLTYINLVDNVVYGKGEFAGGSDIMMEMYESGELVQALGTTPPQLS
jgi:glutaredoxin-related protein